MPSPWAAAAPGAPAPDAALAAAGPGQHPDHLVADLLGVGVEVEQDAGGDALVLADEAEQDVLGADVVVAEAQRLAQRQLEDLLGAGRERDLAGGDLFAGADDPHDLRAHALDRDVEGLEHACRQALLLAQQSEQDVLGADVVVLERPRLFLRQDDHLAGSLCKSLEHDSSLGPVYSGARSRCFSVLVLPTLPERQLYGLLQGRRGSRSPHLFRPPSRN